MVEINSIYTALKSMMDYINIQEKRIEILEDRTEMLEDRFLKKKESTECACSPPGEPHSDNCKAAWKRWETSLDKESQE